MQACTLQISNHGLGYVRVNQRTVAKPLSAYYNNPIFKLFLLKIVGYRFFKEFFSGNTTHYIAR